MGLISGADEVSKGRFRVEVDGKVVRLSNLDRVLYPETGFTKDDLIEYYAGIASTMVPHLQGRPLTMRRFPGGVEGNGFWEKRCPGHRPDWIRTTSIRSRSNDSEVDYCLVEDAATLVWAANLAGIELHTSLATAERRQTPRAVVFDLDPGSPADAVDCADVALTIRGMLAGLDLETLVKSSGSKGLQLYVPLNTEVTYERTKTFAHRVARILEQQLPDLVVSRMKKSLRKGKVFIDWSQNVEHKTTVCVYSMRAMNAPSVSTPLQWDEVQVAADDGDADRFRFGPSEVLERVEADGDLFAGLLDIEQELPEVRV